MLAALAMRARKRVIRAMSVRRRLTFALIASALVALLEFWGGLPFAEPGADERTPCTYARTYSRSRSRCVAAIGASRPADPRRTFGYGRIEVLGALVNGTICSWRPLRSCYEAARRFGGAGRAIRAD